MASAPFACIVMGAYCGRGGLHGGRAMVAIGAILLVKVIHCGAYVAAHDEHAQRFHSVSFTFSCVVVLPSFRGPTLMLVFGSLCVANGHYCGPAGHGGGIALVVSGAVFSLAVLALA